MSYLTELKQLTDILQKGHHVRIISHRNPDGDALGSMLVFTTICDHFQLSYDLVLVDPIPENLLFLVKDFHYNFLPIDTIDHIQNEQTDIVVFLDCGQINRVGILCDFILPHQKIINIDHHMSNPLFGDFNCVADISSTCELLYHIIKSLEIPLSLSTASAIYIGILTDTGLFQYDKVTAATHNIIAHLLELGVDHLYIYQQIYQSTPISWIPLLKKGLENLELYNNDSVAFIIFAQQDISMTNDGFDDTHILFPIMLSTKSIKVCVIIKEKEDCITASLRSKNHTDVSQIAQIFGGGGHEKAAGCRTSKYSLQEFKKKIYQEIEKKL